MRVALAVVLVCVGLSGCGLAAAPCRGTSALLKVVPLIGDTMAMPTDACANVIDPDPLSGS